ncbi:ankyrin repeat and fibronectin type-III domain-containing protein 1 [Phlebotomus argentipes]|uniref:ankyrin repeat and fibronectin type-III domain-containing protein 1 n=1 Tax=Phlebotomus argentipes TaxID=94469 RepID=UPI0028936A19|nr:ankyrin repeat and fibronectin type-III domain-containing protein 1 [Phlebotomus argentipes]XP_059610718.1 ankyrin repeat and fibronectin type-III domain-containing protein 1 [Phlebotomus argentipes]
MEFLIPHPPTNSQPRQMASSQNGTFVRSHSINEQSHHQLLQQQHQQQSQFAQHHAKMTKKQLKVAQAQLNKLTQINIHLHALFSAVEHGHLEKARTILESTDVDVNSVNSDGLAPLDVAVLSNNRSMTKMLLQHGATDRTQFKGGNTLGNHLNSLLRDAENRIQELGSAEEIPQTPYSTRASFSSIIGNAYTGPSVTGCTGTETDKQIGLWERRVKGLRRMLLGWDQARPPDPPNSVLVDVVGPSSVSIRIYEPVEGPLGTKFKVQWSSRADFSNIVGECDISEWNSFQGTMGATCRIGDLTQGRRYFFRACLGNVKGFGHYRTSCPSSVVPSSWYDVEQRENRFVGRQRVLDELFAAVRLARPEDASNIPLETPALQRRNPKKKTTIKQLFSAASKFQKNLRRGIYLACILYHEDKVLVTNEDFIPVIEIDETYPGCLHTDYHWLMKVACTWDDVKSLRTDMERNATSAVHFRTKLLTAACQMQSALCITDLGQLFHKPLRDSHGTVVLSCVNFIKSPKTISVLNSRWIPLNKVHKKLSALHEDNNINEILMNSIQEQINYHQASAVRLTKGLYLGYLKMQSSVDQIQVVVPSKTPNVLPHCKIRDNPHISAEEWEFLKGRKSTIMFGPQNEQPTEVQQLFLEDLTIAAHRLFKYMDTPADDALKHRLYDIEVIELSPDVSFLAICPPPEFSCAVPGQREILLQRGDLLSLPLQAFEMIHLRTYQNGIIQKYSRLSCILELDTVLANHSHREAFSTVEVQAAKERLCKLQELSTSLNAVWKGVRWLMDVISFARDRACMPALAMRDILECQEARDSQVDETKRQLLQPPPRDAKLMKSSPGRGSWPGPAVSGGNGLLVAEHSKSEQHLSVAGASSNLSSRYLSATSEFDPSSRKNSADSNYSHSGHSYYSVGCEGGHVGTRLPPSRSEDTLTVSKKQPHRKRTTTVNTSFSAASSPLLNIRPTYTGTTESVHSLSSDSESASYPVLTSTPQKTRPHASSMTNVKDEEAPVGVVRSRKQMFETLHITEDSQCAEQPFFLAPGPSAGPATRSENRRQALESAPAGHQQSSAANPGTHEKVPARSGESSAQDAEAENVSKDAGIIQVYAAYETGLASGTSLKLHVTTKTTAKEVVDLVVKQLNMAVVLKGRDGPIYTADKLENFCLVAVIGARERCLRDDFKPLQLQNPWKKGRLYVRQKQDLLAAIEHSNREAQMI